MSADDLTHAAQLRPSPSDPNITEVWTGEAWLPIEDAGAEDHRLAAILRRFIAHNTNDHGYVATKVHLILDGEVQIDSEDRALIERLMREAP